VSFSLRRIICLTSSSHQDQPTKEASAARKRLLDSFARYDKISKKIRGLQCPGGPGSSQDRVQMAIMTRANLFLQKNMFPLQVGFTFGFNNAYYLMFDFSHYPHHDPIPANLLHQCLLMLASAQMHPTCS
jgi:hypothetical protein